MGIENERKILLDTTKSAQLWRDLKAARSTYDVQFMDITQGYLSGSARIRHVVPHEIKDGDKYIFTYKVKVMGSIVELESPLCPHDYHKLMLIVKPLVLKTRAKIIQDELTWDIDFFKTPKSGQIYLTMAEVEMPEFQTDQPDLHPLLHPYALKWIDLGDKRFNNKNLANIKKVTRTLEDMDIKGEIKTAAK
jgi:CYTH domain-containing protein